MWLETPNPMDYEYPNFHPRRIKKGHSTPKWMNYNGAEPDFEFLSKYFFKINTFFLMLKKMSKNYIIRKINV